MHNARMVRLMEIIDGCLKTGQPPTPPELQQILSDSEALFSREAVKVIACLADAYTWASVR